METIERALEYLTEKLSGFTNANELLIVSLAEALAKEMGDEELERFIDTYKKNRISLLARRDVIELFRSLQIRVYSGERVVTREIYESEEREE